MRNENMISLLRGFMDKVKAGVIKSEKDVERFTAKQQEKSNRVRRYCPKCMGVVRKLVKRLPLSL